MAERKSSTRRSAGGARARKTVPPRAAPPARGAGGKGDKPAAARRRREVEDHPLVAALTPLPGFLVVGVGASAGGYEAFSKLLHALPADVGVAFVLVQHLDPTHESLLPDLLGARSPLPVVQVKHRMTLAPNRVYVIPPNAEVTVRESRLWLAPRPPRGNEADRLKRHARGEPPIPVFMPIDAFFRSLAEYGRSRAIGVVLSGSGSDGTLGLREIKAAGGITFAQDPPSAAYDSMPRAAVATGAVDLVMPPAQIAEELVRIARHPLGGAARPAEGPAALAGEEHLSGIFAALKQSTGVDFTHYRLPTIRRRLQRRIVLHKLNDVEQYAAFIGENPGEVAALYQDLLINVTRFFREPDSFRVLAEKVFPTLLPARGRRGGGDRHHDRDHGIRVWVPGCSSGEEAYSVAITLLDFLGPRAQDVTVQVFATDIADAVLARARAGIYPEAIAADVSPERLRRYFKKVDGHYQINKSVRDMLVFARQDVTRDPPFSRVDLIVCRNVLIYFGVPLQKRLMSVFHYALKPDGHLLLGSAETAGPGSALFTIIDRKHRLYARRPSGAGERISMALPPAAANPQAPQRPPEARHGGDVLGEANRIVLSRYAPPGVLVDSDYQIIQFRGQTGPYLEPSPGHASLNLLKMAREGLLHAVRAALQDARTGERHVRREGVRVRTEGKFRDVAVEVVPLTRPGEPRHYLVLFEETGARPKPDAPVPPPAGKAAGRRGRKSPAPDGPDARITHLETELAASRDYLQTIIQDLEASNEELHSANEEILSSNEELQSTNEELDTAKEELQSTNEELNTLNDELSGRNEELSRVNSDLLNLLANVDIAIVMVDLDLRLRRFTPLAEKLLNLIPTDAGRPISDIKPNIDCDDLEGTIGEVIETFTVRERECRDRDGRTYLVRVRPYRSVDNKMDGAVIALVDVEAVRRQERSARDAGVRADAADRRAGDSVERRDYAEAVVDALPQPVLVLDDRLNVRSANETFRRRFNLQPGDGVGRPVSELMGGAWASPALRGLFDRALAGDTGGDDRVAHSVPGYGPATWSVGAQTVRDADRAPLVLVSLEESVRPGRDAGRAKSPSSPLRDSEDNGDNGDD